MDPDHPITLVITDTGTCLTTKQLASDAEVCSVFEGYQASFGPFGPDDLIEHLAREYGGDAPFDVWDARGLQSRPDAFSWAATSCRPLGPGLSLGSTDGDSIRLAVAGYQFPDADERRKRDSWHMVDGSASVAGTAWDFRWQALTCDTAPLLCGWLFALAEWAESGYEQSPAPRPPWLIEPNLQFGEVRWLNGRVLITIELDLEFLPPDVREGRIGAGKPEVLTVTATADELRQAAIEFAATIAMYPTQPGASRPISG